MKNKLLKFNKILNKRFSIHVDEKDKKFFDSIKDWWNPSGSMSTLHYYNDLRVKYIVDKLRDNNSNIKEQNVMDVGSGAGLLTEVLTFN